MNGQVFDRFATQLATGRLGRRDLLRRAAGLGLGATALAVGLPLRPRQSLAAAPYAGPFNPPPGWPDHLPWPFGPLQGPCFPVPVPRETTRETGINFYVASLDPDGTVGVIVGIDKKGKELSRFDFRANGRAINWSMSGGGAKLDGEFNARADGDRVIASGRIAESDFEVSGRRDGSDLILPARTSLEKRELALFTQWNRIGKTVFDLGHDLDFTGSGATQASCGTCVAGLGGLALWGPGCALTGPAAFACGGGFLVAMSTWVDNCEGACAN